MGAKNHGVVCPDANKKATLNALIGAGKKKNKRLIDMGFVSHFTLSFCKSRFYLDFRLNCHLYFRKSQFVFTFVCLRVLLCFWLLRLGISIAFGFVTVRVFLFDDL